ncbi:MAG: calcium-binding protein [Nocardioidaceae bacterium]
MADVIGGGPGDNALVGTRDRDWIRAHAGDDKVRARAGADFVAGGKGADALYLGKGQDSVIAGPGDDAVFAGRGADRLYGTNATIHEGARLEDGDQFQGGPGKDRIYLGGGADWVLAGPGRDFVSVTADGDRDVVNCGDGRRDIVSQYLRRDRHDRFRNCEVIYVYPGEI